MGILQSFMKSSDLKTDHEEEDTVSSQNCYDLNYPEKSEYARRENVDALPGEWQNRKPPTRSHELKYLNDLNYPEKSEYARRENVDALPGEWQNRKPPTRSHESKYLNDLNYPEKSEYARRENVDALPGEWQNRKPPTRSHESKYLNDLNYPEKSEYSRRENVDALPGEWQNRKPPTRSHESKYLNDLNYPEKSEYARRENVDALPGEWQNRKPPTRSHESKYLTISVPELRGSSSLAHTCVNDKVKKSGAFVKQNDPPNVGSNGRRHRRRHREEVLVMIKRRVAEKDRWIKHYSSCHRILLVGEGDFSFSTCLASAFGLASNMVATSLDSQDTLISAIYDEIVKEIAPVNSPCSREEEREEDVKNIVGVDENERRIKHYKSSHKILLVGEGDFSFSACLALAFVSAPNIIATSLNSKAFLKKHYRKAVSNIAELRSRGSKVMHGIDATDIANHDLLRQFKYDRIIFNFPHAGFFRNMSSEDQLRHHRRLVSRFLMNAKEMISENGEIHVSHKTNGFHAEFKLENIASSHGLRLIQAVKFNSSHYPGYNTKYGYGGDGNFDWNPSKTFKFGLKTVSF